MLPIVLCADGIEAVIEAERSLTLLLREPDGPEVARFSIDPSEIRAVIQGKMSFQAADGRGHSVNIEGTSGGLKVRLEAKGHPTKNCRIPQDQIAGTFQSLSIGV